VFVNHGGASQHHKMILGKINQVKQQVKTFIKIIQEAMYRPTGLYAIDLTKVYNVANHDI
jgi:hypothetical protein